MDREAMGPQKRQTWLKQLSTMPFQQPLVNRLIRWDDWLFLPSYCWMSKLCESSACVLHSPLYWPGKKIAVYLLRLKNILKLALFCCATKCSSFVFLNTNQLACSWQIGKWCQHNVEVSVQSLLPSHQGINILIDLGKSSQN